LRTQGEPSAPTLTLQNILI